MATEKKRGSWMGHPVLDSAHEHDLHLASALNEFQGGMPRVDAERRALEDYRHEHHARAAAHHFAGMKAGHASGNMEDAKKHHALYSLHVKALGEDPMGPVPEAVRKYHGQAGDKKQRHVYSFRGHDADEFLVRPVTKHELEVVDLRKAEPTAAERVEALRAAVNKAIAGIAFDPAAEELVNYLNDAPPVDNEHVAPGCEQFGEQTIEEAAVPRVMDAAGMAKSEDSLVDQAFRARVGAVRAAGAFFLREPARLHRAMADLHALMDQHGIDRSQASQVIASYAPGTSKMLTPTQGGAQATPAREGHLRLVKKATEDLKKTLDVLAAAKVVLGQLQSK